MPLRLCGLGDSDHKVHKKLDLLERRLRGLEANQVVGHRQLGTIINSFISSLKKTRENLELDFTAVLHRIGVDRSSADVAYAAFVNVKPDGASQLADDASECLF